MKKWKLRDRITALEHQIEKSETARKIEAGERERLHDLLLDAGFLRVTGQRTREDRLRAARHGVLVLEDVAVLAESQYTLTQNEIDDRFLFGIRTSVPGRIDARVHLDFTGDPEILELLAEHIRRPF